jgi:hypothetical protein
VSPIPGADVAGVSPSPGADVAAVSPSPGADVAAVSPSPGADVGGSEPSGHLKSGGAERRHSGGPVPYSFRSCLGSKGEPGRDPTDLDDGVSQAHHDLGFTRRAILCKPGQESDKRKQPAGRRRGRSGHAAYCTLCAAWCLLG